MELLYQFLNFMQPYGSMSYLMIFGVLLLCAIGFPLPEDVLLVTAGVLAARGIMNLPMAIFVTFAGVIIGDSLVYYLGRKFGPQLRNMKFFKWVFTEKRDRRVRDGFHKYGDKLIFLGRFMPGIRTIIFSTAGMYRVPFWKMLAFDGFAAVLSVPFWVWLGYWFGSNLDEIEAYMKTAQISMIAILGVIVIVFLVMILLKRKISNTN